MTQMQSTCQHARSCGICQSFNNLLTPLYILKGTNN